MTNFFDNFDYNRERWFEITSDDVMDLKPDVIVMSAFSRVSDYVWGRRKNSNDIKKELKKKYVEYLSSKIKRTYNHCYMVTQSSHESFYKYIIHVFLPQNHSDWDIKPKTLFHITINILLHSTFRLSAKRIVFMIPGYDVDEKDYNAYKEILLAINSFVSTQNPYLEIFMAVPPSHNNKSQTNNKNDINSINNTQAADKCSEVFENLNRTFIDSKTYKAYAYKLKEKRDKIKGDHKTIAKMILSEYLSEYKGKNKTLAEMIECNESEISRYKSGDTAPRSKERALSLALAMGLYGEALYIFMNGLNFPYPSDQRDNMLELMLNSGERDYYVIKDFLDEVCYTDRPLVKDKYAIDEEKQR